MRAFSCLAMLLLFLSGSSPSYGQSEAALREFFEGKTVVVKLDMPATSGGIDIYAGTRRELDYSDYAQRLKQYGTSIKAGESIIVTRVKVKEKLIEVHLGGGGFGTFGDSTSTSVYVPPSEKTLREKNLEKELKTVTDEKEKKKIREELNDLRRQRERDDARVEAIKAEAEELKKENVRRQALSSGSRFNLRYPNKVPIEALRPEAIVHALARYVEFSGASSPAKPAAAPTSLRKGLTREEVEALLGRPVTVLNRMEGTLRVVTCAFEKDQSLVQAEFVEGVLVRFTIASK